MLLFQGYTSPAEQTHVYKPYQQVNNNNNKKIDYSIPRERITFEDDPLPKVLNFNITNIYKCIMFNDKEKY